MNELVSYYAEVIEDPKFKLQEAFVYSLVKNLIPRIENEEKVIILWNQLTAFMIRVNNLKMILLIWIAWQGNNRTNKAE